MSAPGLILPESSPELPFLRYWAEHLLDPRDPQNARWLATELTQVPRGRTLAAEIALHATLRDADVLDLGCQAGGLLVALAEAGARATGIDVDAALVRGAAIRLGCHGVQATTTVGFAEALPFAPASFDLVTFVDVIEHVADAELALAEIARVLRPGGLLWLQGPNRLSPRWFVRDPHYRMVGISVLPPALGRFYVTRVRRRPRYDVGLFPVGSDVVRTLAALGLDATHLVGGRPARGRVLASALSPLALRFGSMFTLLARKR